MRKLWFKGLNLFLMGVHPISLLLNSWTKQLNDGQVSKIHTSPEFFTFHFSQRHRLRLSASIWVPPFSDMLSALDSTNSSLDSPLKACFSLPKLALPRWH